MPAVWHDGVNVNFHSLLPMQPETRRGVVILMNSFNIVAYESAYRETEEGIGRLLAGLEPTGSRRSLVSLYLLIDALLAAILAIALWPLLRMRRMQRWLLERQKAGRLPLLRTRLCALWEIGFALVFLFGIRQFVVTGLGAQSWGEVLAVFPDFVAWIWSFALIVLFTGVIRMTLLLQAQRAGAHTKKLALNP